jgi:anti-sigma factor RsiW
MSVFEHNLNCKVVAPLLVFYVCDEVSEKERKQIEVHLASCAACSAQVAEERALQQAMIAGPQTADELDSAGILLAQCRSELAEALDDLSAPAVEESWRPFGWLRRWMTLRPVWSGAALVFFGILFGTQIVPWLQSINPDNASGQAVNVMAGPKLSDDQLSKMAVARINVSPASGSVPGTVQLQLSAEQSLVLSGNIDDSDIRRVLTYVVGNGERFDAGVRIDCLDALKAGVRDHQIRRALMTAARKDQNPAVRMKALESLRDAAADDAVRQVLLESLDQDVNPGVRVEAVNLLVRSLEHATSDSSVAPPEAPEIRDPSPSVQPAVNDPSVQRVIRVLEQLQRRDPSRYVRLRSAAALRQIGPREVQ